MKGGGKRIILIAYKFKSLRKENQKKGGKQMFRSRNEIRKIFAILIAAFIALALSTAPVLAEEDEAVEEEGLREERLEEKALMKEEGLKEERLVVKEEMEEERKVGLGFFFPAMVVMPVEIGTSPSSIDTVDLLGKKSELDLYPELSIGLKCLVSDTIGIEPLLLFKYTSADFPGTYPEEKQLGFGLGGKLYYNLVHNGRADFYLAVGAGGVYGRKTAKNDIETEMSESSLDFYFMGYMGTEAFFFKSLPRLGFTLELALPVAAYNSETEETTPKGGTTTKREEKVFGVLLDSAALNFGIHYYFK